MAEEKDKDFAFGLLSLNVRGLREYKKCRKIFNWIVKHGGQSGVSFLQETHSSIDIESKWRQRFRGKIMFSHGKTNSKGVAILLGEKLEYTIISSSVDEQGRFIILLCEIQGLSTLLINSYAPNDEKGQVCLLENIFQKISEIDYPLETSIIWGGDFNCFFDLDLETSEGNPKLKIGAIEKIQAIQLELDLCDIWRVRNPVAKRFTWRGNAQGKASNKTQTLYRRLDYFFISDELQPFVDNAGIIPAPATDHSAIFIKIKKFQEGKRGPSFWKLNNTLLNDPKYIEAVNSGIINLQSEFIEQGITSAQAKWELIKYEVRKISITFSKSKAKKFRLEYKDLESKIIKIEERKDWEKNEELLNKVNQLKRELEERSNYITEGIILRSRTIWYEQGEKNTKFFLSLEKRNKAKSHVRKLIDESDKEIIKPQTILEKIELFYSNLYSSKSEKSEKECLEFLRELDTPKLTNEENQSCEGYLTLKECYDSLLKMGSSKAPGNDGLTKEFYVAFWPTIGKLLVNCLNEGFDQGSLSTTQKQAIITLIQKPGKDVRFLNNWRPISLINVDVKICSKAICNRFINFLPKLIHPDQAAYVKGRTIEDPIRVIADLMEYLRKENNSALLFAADFEKAFDSIEHNFIFAVLKHFGFGDQLIKWIGVMLKDTKSCVVNNGTATGFFGINRGTKQGDPISPYLFIMVIEIMAVMIRSDNKIQGVTLNSNEGKKLAVFADDSTFFLRDNNSLIHVLDNLDLFHKYSSLQINLQKSEIGWIGVQKNADNLGHGTIKTVNFHEKGIKILGIYVSHNDDYLQIQNLDRIFENFKTILCIWRSRSLTAFGKIQVIRSLALPKLLYVCSKIYVPTTFVKKVKTELLRFFWNGKKAKVKYRTIIGEYDQGGLKLPDFESLIITQRIKWAQKFLDEGKNYWKVIPRKYIEEIGGTSCIDENFDCKKIPKNIPRFYEDILNAWGSVSQSLINEPEDVLRQPLWNNSYIRINIDSRNILRMVDKGFLRVHHIWENNSGFNWDYVHAKGMENRDFLLWMGIIHALPQKWKSILKDKELKVFDLPGGKYILLEGKPIGLDKVKSKQIYSKLISRKFMAPTAQKRLSEKLSSPDIEWKEVYSHIYKTTIDTGLRWFQYKLLNNCLYLNKQLYKFKLIDSPRCSFCFIFLESVEHFFVNCIESRNVYLSIKNWLSNYEVILPELNLSNIILCSGNSSLVNFIILLYKVHLYKARSQEKRPHFKVFQNSIKLFENIEYNIAIRKFKLASHLQKFEKLKKAIATDC